MFQSLLVASVLFISTALHAKPSDIRLCEAYTGVNAALGCADDNYLIRFGYKYCVKYVELKETFAPQTQVVLAKIRSCLVTQLINDSELTCENSEERAMDQHLKCYVKAGFCALPNWEKLKIGWAAKSELKQESFRQTMLAVKEQCDRLN